MSEQVIERSLAFIFSIVVGVTAVIQLRNDWDSRGLDGYVTKLLLGLMAFGCVLALLASINILGAHA